MFVVDTNIFIYAAIEDFPLHPRAQNLVAEWRKTERVWHSTWSIFYEFLRVTTHHSIFKHPLSAQESWSFLEAILDSPGFSMLVETDEHTDMVNQLIENSTRLSGNLWHDAHTVALMKEHGIHSIYTADSDFHRFSGIKVYGL